MSEASSSPFRELNTNGNTPFSQVLNFNSQKPDDRNKSLSESYEELKKRVLLAEFKLNNSISENEVLKLKYQSKVDELNQEIQDLHEEKESLIGDQRFVLDTNTQLTQENEDLQAQLQSLKQKTDINKENNKMYELQDSLKYYKNQNEELKNRVARLTKETEMKLNNKDELIAELKGNNEKLNDKVFQLLDEKKTLQQSIITNQSNSEKNDDLRARKLFEDECKTQIEYIRELEQKNLTLSNKLSDLKNKHEYQEILKEDKRNLSKKLQKYESLQLEFDKLIIKYDNVQMKLNKWESSFSNPQEVLAKIDELQTTEKLSVTLRKELAQGQDEILRLKNKIIDLQNEINKFESIIKNKDLEMVKLNKLNELQKKEISFLNERLNNVNEENTLILSNKKLENSNELANRRISELNQICNEYKKELTRLSNLNTSINENNKRVKLDDGSELKSMTSELQEKNKLVRSLMGKLDEMKRINNDLQLKQQTLLKSQAASIEKVVELKENPTSIFNRKKLDLLNKVLQENKDLLSTKEESIATIPRSVYDRLCLEQQDLQEQIDNLNKRLKRLKQFFGKETSKFNEIVYYLLGYKIEILNDFKVQLRSRRFANADDTIVLNIKNIHELEKFQNLDITEIDVKVSDEAIKSKIESSIMYWVHDRKEVSCFLSDLNLQLFDN